MTPLVTDEFGYKVAARKLFRIKILSILSGFIIPFYLIYTYSFIYENIALCSLAIFLSFVGMIAERWLFFAQAKHVVNLYHGVENV